MLRPAKNDVHRSSPTVGALRAPHVVTVYLSLPHAASTTDTDARTERTEPRAELRSPERGAGTSAPNTRRGSREENNTTERVRGAESAPKSRQSHRVPKRVRDARRASLQAGAAGKRACRQQQEETCTQGAGVEAVKTTFFHTGDALQLFDVVKIDVQNGLCHFLATAKGSRVQFDADNILTCMSTFF